MSKQQERRGRRRTVFIHKKFMLNFIIRFCLIAFGAMVLTSLLPYLLTKDTLTVSYRYQHLAIQETAKVILPALVSTNIIVLACFIIATVFVTLYVSHRIGGPLYRLGEGLKTIGQGNLKQQVTLRERDQLTYFASQVNHMTQNLSNRVGQIQREVEQLRNIIQKTCWREEEIKGKIDKLYEMGHQLLKTNG